MFRENLPLFGLMVLLFALFHEAGIAEGQSQNCNASCGNISDISFPFRLKGATGDCGCNGCCIELACDNNNRTTLLADSGKYYVQEIDYVNQTIRLTDESLDRNTCAIPRPFDLNSCMPYDYAYINFSSKYMYLINCTLPAVNLSLYDYGDYVDVTRCVGNSSSTQTYFYAIFGHLTVSDIPVSCTIEAWVETQFSNATGVSVSDIHQELLQGFDVYFYSRNEKTKWFNYIKDFFPKILSKPYSWLVDTGVYWYSHYDSDLLYYNFYWDSLIFT
ncbi:rust resistance kinase Lr10-like isoform X4, partial [Fagus crenata]